MKRKILQLVFFILLFVAANAQTDKTDADNSSKAVKKYIDKIIDIIKSYSIYKDSINWEILNLEVKEASKGVNDVAKTKNIVRRIMNTLREVGDKHSFFMTPEKVKELSAEGHAISNPENKYLGNGIGYIKVPGFLDLNDAKAQNFAVTIQNKIKETDNANAINGWVIDLRNNAGGNMWPMIAGLGPLTGNATLGYLVYTKRETPWFYKNGKVNGLKVNDPYTPKTSSPKIAILIDSLTASSGEFTAISFIGKENTKIFGEHSAGYTTSNYTFPLSDGALLFLAVGYAADRSKKIYVNGIEPDVLVAEKIKDNQDNYLNVAVKWLTGQ
jgi:C-terminal processing protease CtpA/Prc